MTPSEALHLAAQLDEHHTPETNGRIPVCRRCGARTDSPTGRATSCKKVERSERAIGSSLNHGYATLHRRNCYEASSPEVVGQADR